ncbi:MAG TPA: DUF1501 domain-containing protein [Acetobacteraceae bacterium]|nr:DUF1501 domain-containing protein [Acetobacteraceae bacterium]
MALTISRRAALRGSLMGLATIATAGRAQLAMADADTDKRFVVVLLRGALDGMASVVPYGDPHLAALRAPLIPGQPGSADGVLDLGGFYGFHPALTGLHDMYKQGEVLPVHAIAGPYRSRSHFEAQDMLQTGADDDQNMAGITSGWLNRVLVELPGAPGAAGRGLAVGIGMPLLLRGPAIVGSYAPTGFAQPSAELYARIVALNATDRLTGRAIREGLREARFDQSTLNDGSDGVMDEMGHVAGTYHDPKAANGFPALAMAAGKLLAAPAGPRIAAFQLEGWDTHANQMGLLKPPLTMLDNGLVALKTALGPDWKNTTVLVMTEFGRTARMNGTRGTDHGTATAAFLLGGSVAGGKVAGTWPGLADSQLFQNRDLAPTADIRSLAKGALAAQFGFSNDALLRIFPDSLNAAPMNGLLRA